MNQCAMQNNKINYLVIGAGITGLSVVSYLRSHGHAVRVMDSRALPPNANKIRSLLQPDDVCFGEFKWQWLDKTDVLVVSPGVDSHQQAIQSASQQGTQVIGDIELFAQAATKPYIAITGSNGKSTVTTLVTELLQSQGINAKAGANIGKPALDLLADESADLYVLELSSFQLETCHSLQASTAVVLNVSDDHLDRHTDFNAYKAIKYSIYENAERKVFSRIQDDASVTSQCSFGLDQPQKGHYGICDDKQGQQWLVCGDYKIIPSDQITLLGDVGKLNVLAALAIVDPYLQDMSAAIDTIQAFKGLAHRCERIAKQDGITWINDSKATNIGATLAAIEGLEYPLILLLGGVHKGGIVDDLLFAIKDKVKQVIVYGRDADIFFQALNEYVEVQQVDSLQQAVFEAYDNAVDQDTVLLSPACASFDAFDNYQHRGDVFRETVHECLSGGNDAR